MFTIIEMKSAPHIKHKLQAENTILSNSHQSSNDKIMFE